MSGSTAASWAMAFDMFLVLLAFVVEQTTGGCETELNWIWVVIAVLGFIVPLGVILVVKRINTKRERLISIAPSARELISIFDDEVCYLLMDAENFLSSFRDKAECAKSEQDALLAEFHYIEASYYLNKAVGILISMDNNLSNVVDKANTSPDMLSQMRLENAVRLLAAMYGNLADAKTKHSKNLQKYGVVIEDKNVKAYQKMLAGFIKRRHKYLNINLPTWQLNNDY